MKIFTPDDTDMLKLAHITVDEADITDADPVYVPVLPEGISEEWMAAAVKLTLAGKETSLTRENQWLRGQLDVTDECVELERQRAENWRLRSGFLGLVLGTGAVVLFIRWWL